MIQYFPSVKGRDRGFNTLRIMPVTSKIIHITESKSSCIHREFNIFLSRKPEVDDRMCRIMILKNSRHVNVHKDCIVEVKYSLILSLKLFLIFWKKICPSTTFSSIAMTIKAKIAILLYNCASVKNHTGN